MLAHPADAPVIRGQQRGAPPQLTDLERPLAELLFGAVDTLPGAPPPPVDVDQEVDDGDRTAGGGIVVAVPGHTPGSIALLVPDRGVLFTGDTLASYEGAPILGPFNIDRLGAIESVRKQARLTFEIACFGHGQPIVGGASRKILALIRSF